MAAGTVIGSLRVVLGADTAAFETGLKNASKQLGGFASSVGSIATVAAAAFAAAGVAIAASVKHMIDEADNIGKAAQKFGVPVEQLSALKFAADLADVSFESLGKGLGKLSKVMLESAANPAGETAKNLKVLGVAATDASGNLRSTESVFGDIAERFSKMEDGAAKTALAIKIFGKSGADLIPLLNEGRGGIKTLTDEARALGIVLSANTTAAAAEFNDTLKRLRSTHDAITIRIMEGMLPGLQLLASAMLQSAKDSNTWVAAGEVIIGTFNKIVEVGLTTILIFQRLGTEWVAFRELLKTDVFGGGLTAAWEKFKAVGAETQKQFQDLHDRFAALDPEAAAYFGRAGDAIAKTKKGTVDLNTATLASKNALESFLESQKKSIAGHEADALAIGMGVGARERLKITMQAEQIALTNNIALNEAYRAKIAAVADQAARAAVTMAGTQMVQDALTPWDLYIQKLQTANEVMKQHPEYAKAAADYSMKAAAAMADAYGMAAATAMGQFADFFKTFGKGNKEMFLIGKAFSISQAIINTLVGATKALATLPPPLGEIAAAAVVASGMATVAKIVAEKPPAMATGGAMTIPGSGGIDSRMVQFMGSPGETVRVDQNKYGEGGSSRTITLAGVNAKDYYRGDVLRDFVANLNEAIGDGLKIKLA